MPYQLKNFKLNFYYSPTKAYIRSLFTIPSPKHYSSHSQPDFYLTIYGRRLREQQGYNLSFSYSQVLFIRAKIELPNNPEEIIGDNSFNQNKIIQISKKDNLTPPLIIGPKDFLVFEDKFISVAAALYRGDKTIDVFAPYYGITVKNWVNTSKISNFT